MLLFLVLVVNSDWFQILQSYMLLEATSFQAFPGSSFDRLQYVKTDTAKKTGAREGLMSAMWGFH